MAKSRLVYVGALLLVADVAFGACSNQSQTDPQPTADALATGFSTGDLSHVRFDGERVATVQKAYDAIVAGLGDVKPKVTVAATTEDDDTHASATLSWEWPIGGGWSYTTRAALVSRDDGETWRARWSPRAVQSTLGAGETLDATRISAKRGDILGPHGVGLVTERPVVRFGVDRNRVGPAQAAGSARRLAELVGIDVAPYVKQVKAAGPKAFVQAIAFRKDDVPAEVTAQYADIKGVDAFHGDIPLGITKEFAAPILGTVGPVTAEIIKNDPGAYAVGDLAGLSGLEARYDEQLRGTPGVVVERVDQDGTGTTVFKKAATAGKPLHLTLEPRLQLLAERILSSVAPAGAIVAAANGPGNNGYNDATYGRFAPGSTFKTVATLALLREGQTPQSPVDCPTSVNVDGKVFTNDSFYPPSANGRITLATALANSCNTAYINERVKLGPRDLVDAAATLGMGLDHDTGFPSYFGNVVSPTSETTKAADMIGQGQVLASPMTMATVMASVVAGHTVVPQLVTSLEPEKPSAEPLSADEAGTLRQMLRGVVLNGTGVGLRDVPGPPVIAKTGTAEFDRNGKRLTHAWMIAGYGDLAVCAFVDVGQTGAGTAGPLLEQFLRGTLAR